jgi:hypothetical protein
MRKMPLLGAVLITALVISGCGSSESKQMPGEKEFGLTEAEWTNHVERTQALIASCMKRAGFDYVPVDVATVEKAQRSVRHEDGLTRRQYNEKWGYAISTRFDDPVLTIGLGPNAQTMDSLPEAQKAAYEMTLLGPVKEANFAFALDDEDFSDTGGCTREAVSQVFTPDQLTGTYQNPKDVVLDQDPRMAEALVKWSNCMQDQGYQYKDGDQIIDEFKTKFENLIKSDDPATLTGERLDRLHALQADEIKVSLVDLDCDDRLVRPIEHQIETEMFGHELEPLQH